MAEEMATATAVAKEHIEEIRREKYWIGVGKNPLSKPLSKAVKHLSTELYSRDVHFLMELIQNAEDNEYPEEVDPTLEFIITSKDITATGAPATLLVFNNEKGFAKKNMESICSIGESTKEGNRKRGYIGEKGIGFKSVFLLTSQPYIFSNGYQIRFSDKPCPQCDIAYAIPEWVDNNPTISEIQQIYGSSSLPKTTIILPLKPEKVHAVKQQLSNLHPELLLFLSKIKRLAVKENNDNPGLNTIRSISISSEKNFVAKKNIDAESYTLHLTAEADDYEGGECGYFMWRQRFPVRKENQVERRLDVEEWVITLAFPLGQRLNRGMNSVGIYAFLPTETVTNFPFIIQADFLLPSSRETILWDDVWNQGILDCVPTAFMNAFVSLVKTREDAPTSSLPPMFRFLPVDTSSHAKLNAVRSSIKEKMLQENIIPSESHSNQKFFHKPCEVGRLMPDFWDILVEARKQGVKLHNLSSHGKYILHSSFDQTKYNGILEFLGVEFVNHEWYAKCIQSCNLVLSVNEFVYAKVLRFIAINWSSHFSSTNIKKIPLLKHVGVSGDIQLVSINEAADHCGPHLCLSRNSEQISWLIDWSMEFKSATGLYFLPKSTQEWCLGDYTVLQWLKDYANVETLDVYEYLCRICNSLDNDRKLPLAFAHFLYHSHSKVYLTTREVVQLCDSMPLIDRYGKIYSRRKHVLVPANGSKWVELIGSNPWTNVGYVELGEEYLHSGRFAGQFSQKNNLIDFLKRYAAASDIPDLPPPDANFSAVSSPLTKENAFLLLDWIKTLRSRGISMPSRFLTYIKDGSWLKVSMSGCPTYKPPSQSFLHSSSWGSLLQNGSDLVDIPLIDQKYYDYQISNYRDELKTLGVMFECGEACKFIGKHLMSLAANSSLTKTKVIAMLSFIRFLRENLLPPDELIKSVREGRWVRTLFGDRSPVGSVFYDQEWEPASRFSNIPFIDQDYYGKDIIEYKTELRLIGILVGFHPNYQVVIENLKPSAYFVSLPGESLIFALTCIRHCNSSDKLVNALKNAKCLKTSSGYRHPHETFLSDPEWGCILEVFRNFPCIDGEFYGERIFEYNAELRKIGVVLEFEGVIKAFCNAFKQQASVKSITRENVLSFLASYRILKQKRLSLPADFRKCIQEAKWLRTRLGDYRSPYDCILFGQEWYPISQITLLPFVDDSENHYGQAIHEYKDELNSMGVVIDLKGSAKLVLSHIYFPADPTEITRASMFSLLDCVRNTKWLQEYSLSDGLLVKIEKTKWLKTTFGYVLPSKCLLFHGEWSSYLQREDGPFIDEEYYGPTIASYKAELEAIGVIVAPARGASLVASHLDFHSEITTIERIYSYLNGFNWEPENKASKMIWVPFGPEDGTWVSPQQCLLHDKDDLFGSYFCVLDQKNYNSNSLEFFSKALGVRSGPSLDDYCRLWKDWENSKNMLSLDHCCAFWRYIVRHWSSKVGKKLQDSLSKIPAVDGSGEIVLLNKSDVFIPDDLLLRDIFQGFSRPIFAWLPQVTTRELPRAELLPIYGEIGVQNISEAVLRSGFSPSNDQLNPLNPSDILIGKGLATLVLGFLADPALQMDAENRHEIVKGLLNARVFETIEPITLSYHLPLSSGDVTAEAIKMVRWDRECLELITQKLDRSSSRKSMIEYVEYAMNFSHVISEGLLWEKEELIPRLCELIKFGFMFDFDEDAVVYYLKTKNLQIFAEDEAFLSSVFPSN